MNSIPQSFLQNTPPKAFEREENLLSDGTKIQLTAHQHSARTKLVSPDQKILFGSSFTQRAHRVPRAHLNSTSLRYATHIRSSTPVCWFRCACVGSHRLLLNNFTRRSFRANVYSVANSNQRCSGKKIVRKQLGNLSCFGWKLVVQVDVKCLIRRCVNIRKRQSRGSSVKSEGEKLRAKV